MNSETNFYFDEAHEKMEKSAEDYFNNLNLLLAKFKVFQSILKLLKDNSINLNLSPPFNVLDDILKKFSEQLTSIIEKFDNTVLLSINNIILDLQNNLKENSVAFNNIKQNKLKEKEIINNNNLLNSIMKKANKSKSNISDIDFNIFNLALNEFNKEINNYKLNSIKDIIAEDQHKYNKSFDEINLIINDNSQINTILVMFSKNIKNFAELLENICSNIDNEIEKQNSKSQQPTIHLINYKEKKLYKKNKDSSNDVNSILDEDKKDNIENKVSNIIQLFINSETELKKKDVINIFNFLGINNNDKKKAKYQDIFLSKISELCEKNIVSLKNNKNLIHLANIMNSIFFLDRSNINNFYKIIIYSTRIKFRNCYLYQIIRKKNIYLKTNTLWKNIISDILNNKINSYIDDNYNEKNEEKDSDKKMKEKEKEKIKSLLKNIQINKELSKNLKKLNYKQIKDLMSFIRESTIVIISKLIPFMFKFYISDLKIIDIINNYKHNLKIDDSYMIYLQNIILLEKFSITQISSNTSENNYKKEILIISASKFIPKEEYVNIFPLQKKIYPNLKKGLFDNIFQNKELDKEGHIKYLGEYLKIKKIKDSFKYDVIKQKINNSFFEQNKNDQRIKKQKELIQHDLNRTAFLKENPEHRDSIESILFCFYFTFNRVKYYQGINTVISFLYQLLDYDEEKTYNYFYCLQFNTDYHIIFEDNFLFLNLLFSVFEKTIIIQLPEISCILKNINVDIDYFCSSWFITLFCGSFHIIDKNNPPKLQIYFLEKFCLYSWSSIVNLGLVVLEFCYDKIIALEKDDLIKYIMNIIKEEKIFDNNNFEKCKNIYEKNEKIINNTFFNKSLEITRFEYQNKFLIEKDDCC